MRSGQRRRERQRVTGNAESEAQGECRIIERDRRVRANAIGERFLSAEASVKGLADAQDSHAVILQLLRLTRFGDRST